MTLRCLLSCCCALAFGQTKEDGEIRCVFRALAWSAPIEDAAYRAGDRPAPLLIPSDFFSAGQTYRGRPEVVFGRLVTPPTVAPANSVPSCRAAATDHAAKSSRAPSTRHVP